jgi:hypothetical protein
MHKHDEIPFRHYSTDELNALLAQLRGVVTPHHESIALLLAMAFLIEVTHNLKLRPTESPWLQDIMPILHREVLRGSAHILGRTVGVVVDDDAEQVH